MGGRPVAVDWALSKKDFQEKLIAEEPAANKPPKAAVAAVRDGLSDDDDSDSDSDADFDVQESESDEEEEAPGAAAKKKARTHVTAAETDMLSRIMGNLLGEGEEEEAAEAEEDAKPAKKDKTSKKTDEKVRPGRPSVEVEGNLQGCGRGTLRVAIRVSVHRVAVWVGTERATDAGVVGEG